MRSTLEGNAPSEPAVAGDEKWLGQFGPVGTDIAYGYVYALAAYGSDLYAGGVFSTAGGKPSQYLGRWTGP